MFKRKINKLFKCTVYEYTNTEQSGQFMAASVVNEYVESPFSEAWPRKDDSRPFI